MGVIMLRVWTRRSSCVMDSERESEVRGYTRKTKVSNPPKGCSNPCGLFYNAAIFEQREAVIPSKGSPDNEKWEGTDFDV